MAKKLSFDDLPAAAERILEILSSPSGTEHSAVPELVQRIALLEKKIDHLQKTISPDTAVMDVPAVCRILKLRPKAISELTLSGVLPSHTAGRKTLFYEKDVVAFYMTQPSWKAAVSKPAPAERPAPAEKKAEGGQRVDVPAASEILGRSTAAIYQLISNDRIPHHKEGAKVYFFTDELQEWAKNHPPRPRKPSRP
jgi:predicted DNA-binding transcriptional regulator AlpA